MARCSATYIDKSGLVQLFAGKALDEETRVGLRTDGEGMRVARKDGETEERV